MATGLLSSFLQHPNSWPGSVGEDTITVAVKLIGHSDSASLSLCSLKVWHTMKTHHLRTVVLILD